MKRFAAQWSFAGVRLVDRLVEYARRAAIAVVSGVSVFFRALGWRACRFYPTCSHYSKEAFGSRSFFSAVFLTIYRLLRCHPFSVGGYDPLPTVQKKAQV